jgi:CRISPR-associated exonuclease Cas4
MRAKAEDEERLVPLSALQHYSYCPRQCGLIHLEQVFDENVSTLRGRAVHHLVDEPETTQDRGVRIARALSLYSARFGLIGKADVVEFQPDGTAYPVEYKHGRRHTHLHDDIQLAAQALCLEEMTGRPVPAGAIFHHSSRRRREVTITPDLRAAVVKAAEAVRDMLESGRLPPPTDNLALCRNCSLADRCGAELSRAAGELHRLRAVLFNPEEEE